MNLNVILIRHGEKVEWTNGLSPPEISYKEYIDNHNLSAKGYERSYALVGYFKHRKEMTDLYSLPLKTSIAQGVDQNWGQSLRPLQTIEPTARELKLELKSFKKSQLKEMVDFIKMKENETVIVSWCHQQMGEIVDLLLEKESGFKWPKKRYDVTILVKLPDSSVTVLPQRLLAGDEL